METALRGEKISPSEWDALDEAVFDLYGLGNADRVVVNDGLLRAGWQWAEGRKASVAPANTLADLVPYTETFLMSINGWLQAPGPSHIRAEVLDLSHYSPLRVVRFVIGSGRKLPSVDIVSPEGDLTKILERIGHRLDVPMSSAVVGERELRVHGANEVIIIKPAARRFWMRGAGLEDAGAVISESFLGAAT